MTDEATTEAPESQQTTETQPAPSSEAASNPGGKVETPPQSTQEAPEATSEERAPQTKGSLETLREQLAGDDEGLLKSLERYKSVDAIRKAFKDARSAAKNAGKHLTLSDNPTEDEVKAYREAIGIPDEAAEYPVSFGEEFKTSEADTEILDGFKEYAHAHNVDPKSAQAMLGWYQDFASEKQQAMNARLNDVAKKTQDDLRSEWGGEYDGNLSAAKELITAQLGEDGFDGMMNLRLMDGSRLQDNMPFVKMMAQLGADYYGGTAIMTGDVETTSKTVAEKIKEGLALRNTDSVKYFSDEHQAKMSKLYAQRDKLNKRK